jgi:hypothetical protein
MLAVGQSPWARADPVWNCAAKSRPCPCGNEWVLVSEIDPGILMHDLQAKRKAGRVNVKTEPWPWGSPGRSVLQTYERTFLAGERRCSA